MASISSPINSIYGTSGSTGTGTTTSGSATSPAGTDPLANQSTFLTLLVAQLKNQNPASPMDGTTFVTQLAQFSDLEQNLAMRTDLDAISKKYDGTVSSSSGASGAAPTNGTDPSSGNSPTAGSSGSSN